MICHIAIKAALILSIVQVAMATPRLVGLTVLFVLYEYSFSDLTGAEGRSSTATSLSQLCYAANLMNEQYHRGLLWILTEN